MHFSCNFITAALAACAALCSLSIPATSGAVPVDYQIEFTVDAIDGAIDPGNCSAGEPNGLGGFNCSVAVGDVYFGEFTIDDALLAEDGTNLAGMVLSFFIEIAGVVWDYLAPYPDSAFYGFRGPDGLGSESPGFDVENGEVTNLRGGVYGVSDPPYVDFSPLGDFGRFTAGDGRTFAYGSMFIARVAEPPTLSLVAVGLAFLLARERSKRLPARARADR